MNLLTESRKTELLIGITGRICSGKQTLADFIHPKREYSKITVFDETFKFEILFQLVLDAMRLIGLPPKVLDMNEDQEMLLTRIVLDAFTACHLTKTNLDQMKDSFIDWDVPQIIYPIVNTFQNTFLAQRNYFYLIKIISSVSQRYRNFQKKPKYQKVAPHVSLDLFIFIDDTVCSQPNFIDECCDISLFGVNNIKTVLFEDLEESDILRLIRPNWEHFFMFIAQTVKARSNCMKRAVGAVLVRNNRILATGYNGTPTGKLNCFEGGCQRCNSNAKQGISLELCFCFHAEENAILLVGTKKSQGSTLYTTLFPCYQCSKIIIAAGIVELYYEQDYAGNSLTSNLKNLMKVTQVCTQKYVFK